MKTTPKPTPPPTPPPPVKRGAHPGNQNAAKYAEPTTPRSLRIPESLSDRLDHHAAAQDRSPANLVTELIEKHLPRARR